MPVELKHRWSIGNNYLAGITTGDWIRLLRENHFRVDPVYWHRAAFVTLLSAINSYHRRGEEKKFHAQIAATRVEPPLFILGHWRSGTTHLHNLLAKDPRFAFANTYQVVNPHTFLTTEVVNTRCFAWMVPKTRPMDAMEMDFQSPQEDEFAPCLMSLRSLYLGISFPRNARNSERYLTFDNVPAVEIDEWKAALLWFLKKLAFKYGKPLVLKSPPHTARVRLLLEMFPDARFVHIHRHPYQVFQSCRHYHDTATWFTYLQRPDRERIDDEILDRYQRMYQAYFRDRPMIRAERFHEIRFEDLERDPIGELGFLYEKLGLGDFSGTEPEIRRYLESIASYRKNRFATLEESAKEKVAGAWKRGFDEWNYSA